MSTVRAFWGLACPKCKRDDRLHVTVETQALLLPDGTQTVGDEEWSATSSCICTACDHWAYVRDFEAPEGR